MLVACQLNEWVEWVCKGFIQSIQWEKPVLNLGSSQGEGKREVRLDSRCSEKDQGVLNELAKWGTALEKAHGNLEVEVRTKVGRVALSFAVFTTLEDCIHTL